MSGRTHVLCVFLRIRHVSVSCPNVDMSMQHKVQQPTWLIDQKATKSIPIVYPFLVRWRLSMEAHFYIQVSKEG